jgi:hypothetical protein
MGCVACGYDWGAGGNAACGRFNLGISVTEDCRAFPGLSSDLIKMGLLSGVKAGDANARAIAGIGEAALIKSDSAIQAETSAYVKGMLLIVYLEGPDSRAMKARVIVLLKSTAARL